MTKRKGHLWCAIALYLTKEDVFITTKWEGCLQHAVVLSLSLCQTSKWGRALQMRWWWLKRSTHSRLSHQEDRQGDKNAKKQVIKRSPYFYSKPPCGGHAPTYPLNHTLLLFCPGYVHSHSRESLLLHKHVWSASLFAINQSPDLCTRTVPSTGT
jgi:hypothetical protein